MKDSYIAAVVHSVWIVYDLYGVPQVQEPLGARIYSAVRISIEPPSIFVGEGGNPKKL